MRDVKVKGSEEMRSAMVLGKNHNRRARKVVVDCVSGVGSISVICLPKRVLHERDLRHFERL